MSLRQKIIDNSRKPILLPEVEIVYDLVFILNINSKGWILEKICKIIENSSGLHCGYLFTERNDRLTSPLPKARAYWFAHYALAYSTMANYPEVWGARRYVWFTHPDPSKGIDFTDLSVCLSNCTHVFNPNTTHKHLLELIGVPGDKISVPLGGADHNVFSYHDRGQGAVGFVSAYYPRKMPDKMLELIKIMPHRQFILIGPQPETVVNKGILWNNYERYDELTSLPNFRLIEAPYEDYPSFYKRMDVYVSLSSLEGGPIPVIEAMMSNVIPVVSRTGFADDVIVNGETGYVFDVSASPEEVSVLIEKAVENKTNVRDEALNFSWESFGLKISNIVCPRYKIGDTIKFTEEGDAKDFLRGGWHRAEKNGTWTGRKSAFLDIPIDNLRSNHKFYQMSFRAWTFGSRRRNPPTIDIYVNGNHIFSHSLISDSPDVISSFFPADLIKGYDDSARVQLLFSDLVSPRQLGVGRDERKLGVKIQSMNIESIIPAKIGQTLNFSSEKIVSYILSDNWKKSQSGFGIDCKRIGTLSIPILIDNPDNLFHIEIEGMIDSNSGFEQASVAVEIDGKVAGRCSFSTSPTVAIVGIRIDERCKIIRMRFITPQIFKPMVSDQRQPNDFDYCIFSLSSIEIKELNLEHVQQETEPIEVLVSKSK